MHGYLCQPHKNSMKKLLYFLTAVVWGSGISNAQNTTEILPQIFTTSSRISEEIATKITSELTTLAEKSCQQANIVLQEYPLATRVCAPVYGDISQPIHAQPQDLYPTIPFLQNDEHLTLYFLFRRNREIIDRLPQLQQQQQELLRHLPLLHRAQTVISHPPQEDVAWILSQIPEQTDYLLLGERHNFPQISSRIAQLVSGLRKRTTRPILVFTEFLPENEIWDLSATATRLPQQAPLWETLQTMGIHVIGLDPKFVDDNLHTTSTSFVFNQPVTQNIWASFEGLRLRNTRWLSLLNQARKLFPDALFVIYAGTLHVSYGEPYSIADNLPHEQTFVITFYPDKAKNTKGQWTENTSIFDVRTFEQFSSSRILQFNHKRLSRLAGFDIQIKIPNDPQ